VTQSGSSPSSSTVAAGGVLVYASDRDLFYASERVPVASLAFSQSTQALFIRTKEGWKEVQLGNFHAPLQETDRAVSCHYWHCFKYLL